MVTSDRSAFAGEGAFSRCGASRESGVEGKAWGKCTTSPFSPRTRTTSSWPTTWDRSSGASAVSGWRDRMILHIDMDAFFAAVEQLSDPRLQGKPVLICGDVESRSVVAAASYEARPFGVRAGMPAREAKRLCPEGIF